MPGLDLGPVELPITVRPGDDEAFVLPCDSDPAAWSWECPVVDGDNAPLGQMTVAPLTDPAALAKAKAAHAVTVTMPHTLTTAVGAADRASYAMRVIVEGSPSTILYGPLRARVTP